jgi:uncharacterized protein DUF5317
MWLVIGTLGIGVAVGLVLGGRFANLAEMRVRWLPLAIGGFALQSLTLRGGAWPLITLALSYVLLIAFAIGNVRVRMPGARLILVGILLNFAVISLNGGMPVTTEALSRSHQAETMHELVDGTSVKHHLATSDDIAVFLGDVIPLAPIRQIVSVGDLFTYIGVVWLIAAGMVRRRDQPIPSALGAPGGVGHGA